LTLDFASGGPGSTSSRHMDDVRDRHSTNIEGLRRRQLHRVLEKEPAAAAEMVLEVEEATEVGVEVTATVEETPVLGEEETELEEETDTELLLLELELAQSQVL